MPVVQTLTIAENSNANLKKKLVEEVQARRSVDSALDGAQRQAEDQRKCLCKTIDQLTAAREQMVALKKQLEEAQGLKDRAEKSQVEAKKARVEAEKARDKAE